MPSQPDGDADAPTAASASASAWRRLPPQPGGEAPAAASRRRAPPWSYPFPRGRLLAESEARAPTSSETWVPMGPHRPGSRRSLSSGPDLPEAQLTCKWVRRPYPQSRQPWKTSDDLIQTPEDLPGLWRKLLPRSRCGAASRSEDRGILSVITEGNLPNL
jgi:hypothetical protein